MIGGHDIFFSGTVMPHDVDVLLRAVRSDWAQGRVETGEGTFVLTMTQALRSRWTLPAELFIYETREAYESWTACGLTDENADKMVAVTLEVDCVSFVVSGAASPTSTLVNDMIVALKENRRLPLAHAA